MGEKMIRYVIVCVGFVDYITELRRYNCSLIADIMGNSIDRYGPTEPNWEEFKKNWRVSSKTDNMVEWENVHSPSTKVNQYNVRLDESPEFIRLMKLRARSVYTVNAREIPVGANCGTDS